MWEKEQRGLSGPTRISKRTSSVPNRSHKGGQARARARARARSPTFPRRGIPCTENVRAPGDSGKWSPGEGTPSETRRPSPRASVCGRWIQKSKSSKTSQLRFPALTLQTAKLVLTNHGRGSYTQSYSPWEKVSRTHRDPDDRCVRGNPTGPTRFRMGAAGQILV